MEQLLVSTHIAKPHRPNFSPECIYVVSAGEDFAGVSTTLTFTSGDTSMCVGITITMDILLEDDETFSVLATSTDSTVVFTNNQTLVTITSNGGMSHIITSIS